MRHEVPSGVLLLLAAVVAVGQARSGQLHEAARHGDVEAARRLVAAGADVSAVDPETELTPLLEAVLGRHIDTVRFLLGHGAPLAERNERGFTALHAAAHAGDAPIVELLIDRGLDIDDQENTSRLAPLHLAAERDHRDVVRLLLRRGARLNPRTEAGHTPIILAALNTHEQTVKLLREHGADCTFRSKRYSDYCRNAGR